METGTTAEVVIVGGGISGLATAWHLSRAGRPPRVTVLEREGRPGGTAWTVVKEGYRLETGPNGFLDNKPEMPRLCEQLGLENRLARADAASAKRLVFLGDRLRALPVGPWSFLTSGLLSWRGKARLLAERWVRRQPEETDESIHAFGCRRLGREAADVLLDAFVTGILAGDPQLLSLPACFPRIAELEREFGSLLVAQGKLAARRRAERKAQGLPLPRPGQPGAPGGTLTAPIGGMGVLLQTLAEKLGPALKLGVAARSLHQHEDRWHVQPTQGDTLRADAVVLAAPAYVQAELCANIDPNLANEMAAIPYTTAVVAVIGYARADLPKNLKAFGYLSPQRLGRPVLGVLWSSSIFPEQAPPGHFQFRAILGGWRRRDVLEWDDEAIRAAVRADLRATMGIQAEPSFFWLHRWPRAIPQYHLGHSDRLRRMEQCTARLPGLFLTGNAFRGVALNDCARDAELTASRVADYLDTKKKS